MLVYNLLIENSQNRQIYRDGKRIIGYLVWGRGGEGWKKQKRADKLQHISLGLMFIF